jgi:TRAP-type mannitol/chloroaromatic compound transport system permease small subunit
VTEFTGGSSEGERHADALDAGRALDEHAEFHAHLDVSRQPFVVRALHHLRNAIERITSVSGSISKWLVAGVFLSGIVNVVLRYAGRWFERNLTSNRWIETQWYLFALVFLLGFPYILREQVNPRVDFWYSGFSIKRKAIIDFVGHLLFLLPFCWLALRVNWGPILTSFGRNRDGSWDTWRVWETWEQSPDPSGWPRAPIKAAIWVGFALLLLQTIAELIKAGFVLTNRAALAGVAERDTPLRVE